MNKNEINIGDLVIVKTSEHLYIVEVSYIEGELRGRYKTIIDTVDRPQQWDAGGCHGMFDEYELVEILYKGPITIKDNVLWFGNEVVGVRQADHIANCNGYMYVEQYIKANK